MFEVALQEFLLELLIRLLYATRRTCGRLRHAIFNLKSFHLHFLAQSMFVTPTILAPVVSFVPSRVILLLWNVFIKRRSLNIFISGISFNGSEWLLVHLGVRFNLLLLLFFQFTSEEQQLGLLIAVFEKTLFVDPEGTF